MKICFFNILQYVTHSPLTYVFVQIIFVHMEITFKFKVNGIEQLNRDVPKFVPDAAKSHWDYIEIHPVREVENGIYETTDEGYEDFWSVYLHQLNGGIKCVADLNSKIEAIKLAELFENASNYRVYSK